jgi:hypothetical protein
MDEDSERPRITWVCSVAIVIVIQNCDPVAPEIPKKRCS